MRYLAIDLGEKRTGLAVGDDETGNAFPVDVIERPLGGASAGGALLEAIADAAKSHNAHAVVVGLPLNMDGTDSPGAKRARAFAQRISARTQLPVAFQDERLTSAEADWIMAQSGLTHKAKKERRDALAAAAILRDFLNK
ncbi:MAG: Holliday junction resolvase RuvX, partial [Phycisphaerales bacterium]